MTPATAGINEFPENGGSPRPSAQDPGKSDPHEFCGNEHKILRLTCEIHSGIVVNQEEFL
jgi:hypothetical protein